jgi:uncharacterized protein YjdB
MAKKPAWTRFPRSHSTVKMAGNGFKNATKNYLLTSFPRLGLRLYKLLGVDTATLDYAAGTIDIAIDAKTATINTSELGDFYVTPTDYIATRSSMAVSPATASIAVAGTQQLTATVTYSDASTDDLSASTTWVSSDETVATVDASGLVTGVAAGTATITGTFISFTGSSDITVS